MAMYGKSVVCIVLLQIWFFCTVLTDPFPNFAVVRTRATYLSTAMVKFMDDASGISTLQQAYSDNEGSMKFTAVDGAQLVSDISDHLAKVLETKTKALKESVAWAEKIAAEYTWNQNLEEGDVPYIAAKGIKENDTDFVYSKQFMQNVNWDNSSVHIPVEIYEGDINILNGLAWTDRLDEQWKINRKNDDKLLWQYFGSQTGIMRNYPASKWRENGVDLYDVRRRPWYTQGASSPKDMLILVDTSGSTHGQALSLMRQAVDSLLDTLGENDFVNVAYFSDEAYWVGCFKTFVQATYRNKQELRSHVDTLEAKGMASYTKGLEFAFQKFKEFEEEEEKGEGRGAACNRIIMFLTDGGTERPEEVFKEYNWPNKTIRIFGYAVGPTANPIAAVRWMACANRGFFYRVPAMGAIRSTVQSHVSVVARPMALSHAWYGQWSNIYSDALSEYYEVLGQGLIAEQIQEFLLTRIVNDPRGLGMMTTVTLPVYNITNEVGNQTILGVMGSDVTVSEMEAFIPKTQLGPNGYSFAINANGYIVFHPGLKATRGWLSDPPNVDFLEVEYETPEKVQLRTHMIDQETAAESITTYVYLPNERHLDNATRTYYYTALAQSNFSIGIVLPDYVKFYVESVDPITEADGLDYLQNTLSAILVPNGPNWEFCPNVTQLHNESTSLEDLLDRIENDYDACDNRLVQMLFFDAMVTEGMDTYWSDPDPLKEAFRDGVTATFVGTNAGLTRIYPANESTLMEELTDLWKTVYFKRAIDNEDKWMFSAVYHRGENTDPNATEPVVTVTKTTVMSTNEYRPAVAGVIVNQTKLRTMLMEKVAECDPAENDRICYLLDDAGFLILGSDEDSAHNIGRFLGDRDLEPELMARLVNVSVFLQNVVYDFQAACATREELYNAGPRTLALPAVFEMLTLKWWTAKFAWLYLHFNLYEWLIAPFSHSAYAEHEIIEDGKKYRILDKNYSCIDKLAQYALAEGDAKDIKDDVECGNCTRTFATAEVPGTNLLLVMVDRDCNGNCDPVKLPQAPETNPAFPNGGDPGTPCHVKHRYRRRPACYDYNAKEDSSDCGRGAQYRPSWTVVLSQLTLIMCTMLCLTRS